MTPESKGPSNHVVRTSQASASLSLLCNQARTKGVLPVLLASLRAIEQFLTTMPREWGDPFWRLPGLYMVVYRRIFEQLLVVNAVHEREPFVWLRSITPVLNHPLAGI